jgi:hypothetical protein
MRRGADKTGDAIFDRDRVVVKEPTGLVPAGLGVDDVGGAGPIAADPIAGALLGELWGASESRSQVPTQHLSLQTEPLGEVVAAELLVLLRGNRALPYFIFDDRP